MILNCKLCGEVDAIIQQVDTIHKNDAYCPFCGQFIKHIGNLNKESFTLYFGKFKGYDVKDLSQTKEGYQYLTWLFSNGINLRPNQKQIIKEVLGI